MICFKFWKYLNEDESYERDQKIFESYSSLGFSNMVFGGLIFSVLSICRYLILHVDGLSYLLFNFAIGIGLFHYAIQYIAGRSIYRRVRQARWEAAKRDFSDLLNKIKENFNKEEHWEELHEENYGKDEEENESYFKDDYSQGKSNNDVKEILKKFDLPLNTTDIKIIKKRYRHLAKKYHPDMPDGNEVLFKQVVLDYEVLQYYFANN